MEYTEGVHRRSHNGGDSSDPEKKGATESPSYNEYAGEGFVQRDIRGLETSAETSLHRGLKSRHISMIAIGGALGTGLLIGTGKALSQAGPGSVFITYTVMGLNVFVVMSALGAMSAWIPLSAGFTGYATRYCHPSLGFALGWRLVFFILLFQFLPGHRVAAPIITI